jgi:hypothetical protein
MISRSQEHCFIDLLLFVLVTPISARNLIPLVAERG